MNCSKKPTISILMDTQAKEQPVDKWCIKAINTNIQILYRLYVVILERLQNQYYCFIIVRIVLRFVYVAIKHHCLLVQFELDYTIYVKGNIFHFFKLIFPMNYVPSVINSVQLFAKSSKIQPSFLSHNPWTFMREDQDYYLVSAQIRSNSV